MSYEYFKDNFVLSTKSAYQPGQQVRLHAPPHGRPRDRSASSRASCFAGRPPACTCRQLAPPEAACPPPQNQACFGHGLACCLPRLTPHPTLTKPQLPPACCPQVFISYGAQTNGSLFQYYGFTELGNQNDVYSLTAAIGGQPVKVCVAWACSLCFVWVACCCLCWWRPWVCSWEAQLHPCNSSGQQARQLR